MRKSSQQAKLLPFHMIKAASDGNVGAINAVLQHYEGYIVKLSTSAIPFHNTD